ncbi:MAG: hypothetical protein M3464_02335 [Chloroflexota bacterium]|nr:hypothetical protein [Chloroflexota bacterium]
MDAHYYQSLIRRRNGFLTRRPIPPDLTEVNLDLANGSGATRASTATLPADADEHDLETTIQRVQAATVDFINGRPEAWKAICSRQADATLFGDWGGYERGWDQLGPRYDRAAARFVKGEVSFEELARHVTPDLASTVPIERSWVWLTDAAEPVSMTLRVTHLYRREVTGWALLHRHADRLASSQLPASPGAR